MTLIYENSVITKQLDAFNDVDVLVDAALVYNYKRHFCGQDRLDLAETTDIFTNPTDYEDGPVIGDVNKSLSCRDAGATAKLIITLEREIPKTYQARKIDGTDVYQWVDPDTSEPLELPDSWDLQDYTDENTREPFRWKRYMDAIIEAINNLQAMEIQPIVIQYVGNDDRQYKDGNMSIVDVPSVLRYQDSAYVLVNWSQPTPRSVLGGVVFVLSPEISAQTGRPAYWARRTLDGESSLLWADVGVPTTTYFTYDTHAGNTYLASTRFSPSVYFGGLTAENMFDTVETEPHVDTATANETITGTDDGSALSGVFASFTTAAARRVRRKNTWYPSESGFMVRVTDPHTFSMPFAYCDVKVFNADDIELETDIKITASCRYSKNGKYLAPPFSIRALFAGQSNTYGPGAFSAPDSSGWSRLSATWTVTFTPDSDDWITMLGQEIIGDISAEFMECVTDGGDKLAVSSGGTILGAGVYSFRDPWRLMNPTFDIPSLPINDTRLPWGGVFASHQSYIPLPVGTTEETAKWLLQNVSLEYQDDPTPAIYQLRVPEEASSLSMYFRAECPNKVRVT